MNEAHKQSAPGPAATKHNDPTGTKSLIVRA